MNPIDSYLMEKNGGFFGDAGKKIMGKLPDAAASIALGAGVTGASIAVSHLYNAATKRRDFRNMLEVNPELESEYKRDPKFFNQAFTTLRRFTPDFTKDPLVAGSYMHQMMGSPNTAGSLAVQALSEAKNLRRPGQEAIFGLKNKFKED